MSKALPVLPPRLILDFAQKCNLRCDFCPVWGQDPDAEEGVMKLEHAAEVMDQLVNNPLVQPAWYGEPLLIPNLQGVLGALHHAGAKIAMNTNGLKLTKDLAEFFCRLPVDSIMFSIDAATSPVLKQVRGIWAIWKIEEAIELMMKTRGNADYPRIGVSFTIQEENRHELGDFKEKWVGAVDVVRIGLEYKDGRFQGMEEPKVRVPCPLLYETMVIDHDGVVPICCLDSKRSQVMGNVFSSSVSGVWNGEKFQAVRQAHEEGRWDDVPFCKGCNGWADKDYQEATMYTDDGNVILIRYGAQYTWYNRADRLHTWKKI